LIRLRRLLCVGFLAAISAGPALRAQELVLPQADVLPAPEAPWVPPVPEPIAVPEDPFDPYLHDQNRTRSSPQHRWDCYGDCWTWQVLPEGLVFRSYLAGPKESRISTFWFHEKDVGWLWDATLGGRVGLLRHGSQNAYRPEGFQVDIEGAGMPRLDPEEERDLISTDFRFGVPLTYALGIFETKLAYYHLSSHLGDEFMLKNPGFPRINYSRDAIVLGLAAYLTDELRVYAEAGYALYNSGGSEPWEFQFGAEFSPAYPTFSRGAPFAAMNVLAREEVDFGGTFTAQAGWQWRGFGSRHLLRAGVQYQVGKSPQLEFFDRDEEHLGLALWYDY
jgi:hypothetical protein